MTRNFSYARFLLKLGFSVTALVITSLIGIGHAGEDEPKSLAGLRFDGMYAMKKEKTCYIMRFFKDGLVLAVSMDEAYCGDTIGTVINRDDRMVQRGHYVATESHIEFSTLGTTGVQVDYEGEIQRDSLVLNSFSHFNKRKFPNEVYRFYLVPIIAREVKAQEKEASEVTKKEIRRANHLKGIVVYNKYGNPESYTLEDKFGKNVAQRLFEFNRYNPNQIARELLIDPNTGKVFHITEYDAYGKPRNQMWLCLDSEGAIVTKDGKPNLVKPFNAESKLVSRNEYDGAFLSRKILEIYPCENCSNNAESKDCTYLW